MTEFQTDAVRLSSGGDPYKLRRSVSQQQISQRDSTHTFTSKEGIEIRQKVLNDHKINCEYASDIGVAVGSCPNRTCSNISKNGGLLRTTKVNITKSRVQIGDIYINGSNNNTPDEFSTAADFQWPPELQVSYSRNKIKKKIWLSIASAIIVIGLVIVFQVFFRNYDSSGYKNNTDKSEPSTKLEESTTTSNSEPIKLIIKDKNEADSIKSSWIKLNRKIRRIIIDQTSGPYCLTNCSDKVHKILLEDSHQRNISHYYLIDDDGSVYEERDHRSGDDQSSTIDGSSFNDIGFCVAFIGSFHDSAPSDKQQTAFKMFIEQFVKEGIINKDHTIFIQDQLMKKKNKAWELNSFAKDLNNFRKVRKIYWRKEWQALPRSRKVDKLISPVKHIVITETNDSHCSKALDCRQFTRDTQAIDLDFGFADIAYGFLIGGQGNGRGFVIEGRGFDYQAEFHFGENDSKSLFIAFMGRFRDIAPTKKMMNALERFLEDSVALGKLHESYTISTNKSPDHKLYDTVRASADERFREYNGSIT